MQKHVKKISPGEIFIFPGQDSTIKPFFSDWKFFYGKIIVIFFGGWGRGRLLRGKLPPDTCHWIYFHLMHYYIYKYRFMIQ